MAKATKGARNITVRKVKFRWRTHGNDQGISLTIWPADLPGPDIWCSFSYGLGAVTSRLVRQVIDLAMDEHGYDETQKGERLVLLHIEKAISPAPRSSN